jgi:hypothetical protein
LERESKYKIAHRYYDKDFKIFRIEPEIVAYVNWLSPIIKQRYSKPISDEQVINGFIGQELFAGLLLQYKIPNVYANPLYKDYKLMRQISEKHFDIFIPSLPKGKQYISIKTVQEGSNYIRFMANAGDWKNEIHDIVVVMKLDNMQEKRAHIAGWLTTEEVEGLPINNYGAYWTYLDEKSVEQHNLDSTDKLTSLHEPLPLIDQLLELANE